MVLAEGPLVGIQINHQRNQLDLLDAVITKQRANPMRLRAVSRTAGVAALALSPASIQLTDGVFAMIATHGAELVENNAFGLTCCAALARPQLVNYF